MEQHLYKLLFFNAGLILATGAGISRYRFIDETYRPFVLYVFACFANELVSLYSSIYFKTTVLNNNIFMLVELLLLNWQFKNWCRYPEHRKNYVAAAIILSTVYFFEWCRTGGATNFFYFNVLSAFYLAMCATRRLAWLVMYDQRRVYKNPGFIICAAIIFYFCIRIIIEAFWFYGLHKSPFFRNEVYIILMSINLFVNILYGYAILWIQKKPDYITFYG